MTSFLYIGLLSARYIRSTKGISRIEALRAYSPYSLWGGSKMRNPIRLLLKNERVQIYIRSPIQWHLTERNVHQDIKRGSHFATSTNDNTLCDNSFFVRFFSFICEVSFLVVFFFLVVYSNHIEVLAYSFYNLAPTRL